MAVAFALSAPSCASIVIDLESGLQDTAPTMISGSVSTDTCWPLPFPAQSPYLVGQFKAEDPRYSPHNFALASQSICSVRRFSFPVM